MSNVPSSLQPSGWAPHPVNNIPALTMTVNAGSPGVTIAYVFDTAMSIEHDQSGVVTNNPVQTGTSVNDHFYLLPMRVTAELGMSDAMQSFTFGQFSGGPSRSVNAYRTLLSIQAAKNTVSIATRLAATGINCYSQMMITDIRAQEDKDTRFAGRFWVTFQQIITANVQFNQGVELISGANFNPSTDTTRPQAVGSTLT